MKLPILWIAAAFAAGIALLGAQPLKPNVWLALSVAAILAALAFLLRRALVPAWFLGTATWVFLGGLAASLEPLAVPPNHVATLVAAGRLDTSEPLRWRGRLRTDPARLPWGLRYELNLDEVEVAGRPVPVVGGLRISYFRNAEAPEQPPSLRAGDRVEALVRARVPHNFLNPGAFDARAHLARQNVHLTGSLRSVELLHRIASLPPTFAYRMARARGRLLDRVDALFASAPDHAAMLRAMLLGDRNFVDHDLAEAFQKTAVYHVLVISGLHVAALAAFVYWLGRRLRLSLPYTIALALVVLGAYVSVVEDRPPILRAALMAAVFLCSRLLFRRVELLNTTALAALLILAAEPSALVDPSFQLSFLAVGMIGALGAPWVARTSGPYRQALAHLSDVTRDASHAPRAAQFRLDARAVARWLGARLPQHVAARVSSLVTAPCGAALRLWEVLLVSATIQLGMLPLLAHYFHRISLAGPLANIPAVLLAGLIVPVGFLAVSTSLALAPLGSLLAKLLDALVAGLLASVSWFSHWPGLSYRIPGPPAWLLGAFFAALILMAIAGRSVRPRRWQLILAAPLVALAICVATYPFAPRLERGKLEVTALDVGQGDSIFAAFPDGRTMLTDGGGSYGRSRVGGVRTGLDIGEQVVSPYLWYRGLKRLDVVALTHAHQDHLDGLNAVLRNFRVRELWVGRDVASSGYRALVEVAAANGVQVVHQRRGRSFAWDGVTGLVLWPEEGSAVAAASNNDSLVLRLEYGAVALLLPGDIEQPVEHELAERGDLLAAGFLKVAHHGSRTSTSEEFLADVAPQVAVVSVGENNPFGHPHREVLERLQGRGIRLLRTDRDGAVSFSSDGRSLHVLSFAQEINHTAPGQAPR